eukprot:TRINITY_DN33515_c0_g1_i1.p1 TRINITY_DN33515_c0_g1~~TRINITY_DN33515_c0_g1_i1.p1  ORF type:complete len:238 (-),score=25.99 TRINITY_DN33515_c0_g1_i1:101-814(-)
MAVSVLRPVVYAPERYGYPHVRGPVLSAPAMQSVQHMVSMPVPSCRVHCYTGPAQPVSQAPLTARPVSQASTTRGMAVDVQQMTNSFLYCPLILSAADLLDPARTAAFASMPWWCEAVAVLRRGDGTSLQEFLDAYEGLLLVARESNEPVHPEDSLATPKLRMLLSRMSDKESKVSLRWIVASLVDAHGHLPPLSQDLILQIWGGLQFAGDMQTAADLSKEGRQWFDSARVASWPKA